MFLANRFNDEQGGNAESLLVDIHLSLSLSDSLREVDSSFDMFSLCFLFVALNSTVMVSLRFVDTQTEKGT